MGAGRERARTLPFGMHRNRAASFVLLGLAAILPFACPAATVDGPYVVGSASGGIEAWTVEADDAGARKQARPVAPGDSLVVPAVGSLPAFAVVLRKPAERARDTVSAAATAPLFVVADTHGEFEILVDMLRAHRVVNGKLGWSFGRGQLVVLGDVFDRGANQVEILWLLYELEAQARKAGGAVHLVLGNHETMVLRGDLRYLNPKYQQIVGLSGVKSYAQLFDARSVLGQWLRTRPAVLELNDSLYLHGGVSPALVARKWSLAEINDGVRAGLNELPPFGPAERERVEFLLGEAGPLWYRGYFPERSNGVAATMADVDASLAQFGVQRVLVGHTIVPTITRLYGGKVIAVQVYPGHEADGRDHFECLSIRNGKLLRALPDGSTQPL
jgi:hypothetical protein